MLSCKVRLISDQPSVTSITTVVSDSTFAQHSLMRIQKLIHGWALMMH